jgi:hypothetical protein
VVVIGVLDLNLSPRQRNAIDADIARATKQPTPALVLSSGGEDYAGTGGARRVAEKRSRRS